MSHQIHQTRVAIAPSAAWRAAVVACALGAALAPVPPVLVERWYSTTVYLMVQPWLTAASNRVGFALFDALLVATILWWLASVVADVRGRDRMFAGRVVLRMATRTTVACAGVYLAFLLLWGLNYRRVPLTAKVQYDATAVSALAARDMALVAADRLAALHDGAHAGRPAAFDDITPSLAGAFASVQRDLGARRLARPARPKRTLLDWYFRRASVEGMTAPFFLETLVESDLLPVERPFAVAHEWSHLAGYADEGEANFVGWLTCLGGDAADQYSGWLFLFGEMAGGSPAADRADLFARLAPGPLADLRAIAERIRRQRSPRVATAGWRVYDRYLKANRVGAGAASYGHVVRLVLGVRFAPGWRPILRPQASGRVNGASGVIGRRGRPRGSFG